MPTVLPRSPQGSTSRDWQSCDVLLSRLRDRIPDEGSGDRTCRFGHPGYIVGTHERNTISPKHSKPPPINNLAVSKGEYPLQAGSSEHYILGSFTRQDAGWKLSWNIS